MLIGMYYLIFIKVDIIITPIISGEETYAQSH